MVQLTLALDAKPRKADLILAVLKERAGQFVHAGEFMDGRHGFRCSSYSQRIGELRRRGHDIKPECHGEVASYMWIGGPDA